MPHKLMPICDYPLCNSRAVSRGRCASHPKPELVRGERRSSAASRGYGAEWRRIREETLRAYCIPEADWPLYDVDHRPPYDPIKEPDHRMYTLVPMLKGDHSRKTAQENGGFGNKRHAY